MAPYVRVHGNQVALVHGARDKESGKVQQRTLFTLYSKAEARAATGEHDDTRHASYFRRLLEDANPDIKFDWQDLNEQIRQKMGILPDIYPLQQERSTNTFRKAMDEFAKQLILTNPSESPAGRQTLKEFAGDLRTLVTLIGDWLDMVDIRDDLQEESPFDHYDPFCWRNELQGNEVPPDLDEISRQLYELGEYDRAEALLSLLVRCFPNYADGFNRLGLIALCKGEVSKAVELFQTTVKVGRNLFPRRIAQSEYWSNMDTRPYIRGLMNLALALNQAERYGETLKVCDQLYRECGPVGQLSAMAHRATAYLNLGRWQDAYDDAACAIGAAEDEGFVASYALFELGRKEEAIEHFLYSAAVSPFTALLLLDVRKPKAQNYFEIDDYNAGVELCRSLLRFFDHQSAASKKFFKQLKSNASVKAFLQEVIERARTHHSGPDGDRSDNFEKWSECKSREFAKKLARKVMAEISSR